MLRLLKRRSKKAGLPPGTLVFVGEHRPEPAVVSVIDFSPESLEERVLADPAGALAPRKAATVSWINVDGVHDVGVVRTICEGFGIHPLVQEDVVNTAQRAKVEDYGDYLFIVIRMLYFDPGSDRVIAEQVSLVVGSDWLISFQEVPGDVFDTVRERLRASGGRVRQRGADYLAYALLDAVIDQYFVLLELFGERAEEIEDLVLREPTPHTQARINAIRRELVFLRRSVWPVRELFAQIERSESKLLSPETHPFFRDAYDHTIQVIDIVESLREVLSGLMDLYASSLSNRMNEIMKFLTMIGTIFIPLTFVVGIYGMNFAYMPELGHRYGYPIALAGMLGIAGVMIVYFRLRKWL
jgi:magnesium transporter